MYIKEEVMAESSYYQYVLAKGEARGEARGEAKGVMSALLHYLEARYPGLESIAGLRKFASRGKEAVDSLFHAVIVAPDRQAAASAIRQALRSRAQS